MVCGTSVSGIVLGVSHKESSDTDVNMTLSAVTPPATQKSRTYFLSSHPPKSTHWHWHWHWHCVNLALCSRAWKKGIGEKKGVWPVKTSYWNPNGSFLSDPMRTKFFQSEGSWKKTVMKLSLDFVELLFSSVGLEDLGVLYVWEQPRQRVLCKWSSNRCAIFQVRNKF